MKKNSVGKWDWIRLVSTAGGVFALALCVGLVLFFTASGLWGLTERLGPGAGGLPPGAGAELWRLASASLCGVCAGLAMAAPVGLLAGLFLYLGPRWAVGPARWAFRVMSLLPGVVYALALLAAAPRGGGLAAVALLALMMAPLLALAVERALAALPQNTLESAQALGAGRVCAVFTVGLPALAKPLLAGALAAAGRAGGQTLAVLLVAAGLGGRPGAVFLNGGVLLAAGAGDFATACACAFIMYITSLALVLAKRLLESGAGYER